MFDGMVARVAFEWVGQISQRARRGFDAERRISRIRFQSQPKFCDISRSLLCCSRKSCRCVNEDLVRADKMSWPSRVMFVI